MSDNKIMFFCMALVACVVSISVTQCMPPIDAQYTARIEACTSNGGSYIEGSCIQMCGDE